MEVEGVGVVTEGKQQHVNMSITTFGKQTLPLSLYVIGCNLEYIEDGHCIRYSSRCPSAYLCVDGARPVAPLVSKPSLHPISAGLPRGPHASYN